MDSPTKEKEAPVAKQQTMIYICGGKISILLLSQGWVYKNGMNVQKKKQHKTRSQLFKASLAKQGRYEVNSLSVLQFNNLIH